MRGCAFSRLSPTGGVIERLVVEVEGNVHLDLDRAGLDSGARRRHRSEKGARGEGEKSNEKCAEHGVWLSEKSPRSAPSGAGMTKRT